jgi:uncharacterized protein YhhL (DUF1145 family)
VCGEIEPQEFGSSKCILWTDETFWENFEIAVILIQNVQILIHQMQLVVLKRMLNLKRLQKRVELL